MLLLESEQEEVHSYEVVANLKNTGFIVCDFNCSKSSFPKQVFFSCLSLVAQCYSVVYVDVKCCVECDGGGSRAFEMAQQFG